MTISVDDPRWNAHTGAVTRKELGDTIAKHLARVASESDDHMSFQAFTNVVRGLARMASDMRQEAAADMLFDASDALYGAWGKEARFPLAPPNVYIPPEAKGTSPEQPEGTDLFIWRYVKDFPRESNVPCVIVYQGRQSKRPVLYSHFSNEAERERTIEKYVVDRRKQLEEKQKIRDEKKQLKHGFTVGDILYSSWGYDQTNIDFYEVTEAGEKSITIRQVKSVVVKRGRGTDYVMADPGSFIGPPMKKIPQFSGGKPYVKIESYAYAYEWEGNPLGQTASGYGH